MDRVAWRSGSHGPITLGRRMTAYARFRLDRARPVPAHVSRRGKGLGGEEAGRFKLDSRRNRPRGSTLAPSWSSDCRSEIPASTVSATTPSAALVRPVALPAYRRRPWTPHISMDPTTARRLPRPGVLPVLGWRRLVRADTPTERTRSSCSSMGNATPVTGCVPQDARQRLQRWWAALQLLPRTGVIVAVPDVDVIGPDPSTVMPRLSQTIAFMRGQWEFGLAVLQPALGLAGHSWGANATINAAASGDFGAQAYASVAVTRENNYAADYRAPVAAAPTLLVAGMDDWLAAASVNPTSTSVRRRVIRWRLPASITSDGLHGPNSRGVTGSKRIVPPVPGSSLKCSLRFSRGTSLATQPSCPTCSRPQSTGRILSGLNGGRCAAKVIFRTSSSSNLVDRRLAHLGAGGLGTCAVDLAAIRAIHPP